MKRFLMILFSLCFLIACSSEKPSDTGRQTTSDENEKNIAETSGTSDDHPGLTEINPSETTRDSTSTKNTPPELSRIKLMPEVFKPGDRFYIDAAANDIDGDDVSITYEWTLNGEPAGSGKEITADIKRGDKISVKITPYDGETYGSSITLNREIRNLPPMLAKENKPVFDGKTYTCQINAVDPDGDDLTYTLKEGPRGLTVGESGTITWDVPPGYTGNQNIRVLISDNQGGELLAPFTIKIKFIEETDKVQEKTK